MRRRWRPHAASPATPAPVPTPPLNPAPRVSSGRRRTLVGSMKTASDPTAGGPTETIPAGAGATPEQRRQRAAELYRAGRTLEQTGLELLVSKSQIERDLVALGVPRRGGGARRKYPLPETRECARAECGVMFTPTASQVARGDGRYCSAACGVEARRIHPDPGERVCALEGCGARFRPESHDAARGYGRFCSRDCYYLAERRYPDPDPRPCESCGRLFTPRYPSRAVHGRGKCCSRSCAARRMWKRGLVSRSDGLLWSGRARQRWLGRWAHKDRRVGRRGLDERTKARIHELSRDQRLSQEAIAIRLGISRDQVKRVLAARV